jgi:prepilin-type N-terminal cleavage/methylation domain-containing protein
MVKKHNTQSGVTLIEMIVVVAIFALVSSVLLFNYSDFSTAVSLRGLSQEVALSIRKAQTYATSAQIGALGGQSYPGYGISFSLQTPTGAAYEPDQKQFVLFADIPLPPDPLPNKQYDADGDCGSPIAGGECLERFSITTADKIVAIETDATGRVTTGSVTVTFRRPTPDVIICYSLTGPHDPCISSSISYVRLYVESAKGGTRTVTVWNTGQISTN